MYALRLSIVWIFIVLESVKCSISDVLDYNRAAITIEKNDTNPCNATRECLSCTTSRLCIPDESSNKLKQIMTINCSMVYNKPYCDIDTGLCTNVAPNHCPSNDFICPSIDGVYPDPNNCARYHICVNGYRITNTCPPNNIYDTQLENCKFSRYSYGCITINCKGKEGQYFVYPTNDKIYGTCVNEQPYFIGRCKAYEKFDINLKRCTRVCKRVENQPTDDCQKYIRCAQIGIGRYEPVLQYCACDKGFDEDKGICIKEAKCLNKTNSCKTETLLADLLGLPQSSNFIINNSDNKNSNNSISNGNDNANGNIVNGNSNKNNSNSGNVSNVRRPALRQFIINNSENSQGSNKVSNGNDEANGNIVNGNDNANNKNEGDVGNEVRRPGLRPLIINNSGNSHGSNKVSNGNDNENGNIVNGNGNANNKNEGDVGNEVRRPGLRPLIINNSENSHGSNKVSNGNDNENGNIVNGNGNANNKNEGDVGNEVRRPGLRPLIINNSGNNHSDNNVSNGNDSENGNIVNGNGNANNKNEGDVGNEIAHKPGLRPLIINNSENSHSDNDVSNGDDRENGNIVNGNGNGNNSNSGGVGNRLDLRPLIINNSENSHSDNDVSNGDDRENGNIVNGNGNGNNSNSGDVGNRLDLRPLIINNSENSHSDNDVSNGDDRENGNIVNGNGNSNNENQGNVSNHN